MPRSLSALVSNVFLALVLCLAPNFKLWLESFHCPSTALEFGTQVLAELFCRKIQFCLYELTGQFTSSQNGTSELSQTQFRLSCLISIQEEILFLSKVGMERGDGARGFCIVVVFKDTKLVMKKKKDKIEDPVFNILSRFYKQMYLWVFFLEVELTEKWGTLVFCKLYNYICGISSFWWSKRTFLKGAVKVGEIHLFT